MLESSIKDPEKPKAKLYGKPAASLTDLLNNVVELVESTSKTELPDLFILHLDSDLPYGLQTVQIVRRKFPERNFLLLGSKNFFNRFKPLILRTPFTGCLIGDFTGQRITEAVHAVINGEHFCESEEGDLRVALPTKPNNSRRHKSIQATIGGQPMVAPAYTKMLESRLRRSWFPPKESESMFIELRIIVDSNGVPTQFEVTKSSCSERFKKSAQNAVRRAAPFELPSTSPSGYDSIIYFTY